MTVNDQLSLDERSLFLRRQIVKGLKSTRKGHVGSALSLVEILRVLYDDVLRFRPNEPTWKDRDRCILSPGHGCLALYAILVDKGFFPADELETFVQPGSRLGGCSESIVPGVEATTGSLGHGLSIGVGMALSARIQKRDSKVFVILGDGELGEGSVWEAAMSASKHKLSNLIVIVLYNKVQCSGPTREVTDLEPLADKWTSFGFKTQEIDGHDVAELRTTFGKLPYSPSKPSAIICHTVKGKGIARAEDTAEWHWKTKLSDEFFEQVDIELKGKTC